MEHIPDHERDSQLDCVKICSAGQCPGSGLDINGQVDQHHWQRCDEDMGEDVAAYHTSGRVRRAGHKGAGIR